MNQDNINSYEYLVKERQGLVYNIVNRFHVSAFERDDLIQAGMMGLLNAIRRYDINRNIAFSTYATPYIIRSVQKEYYKKNTIISSEYYNKLINNVKKENGNYTYQELAIKYKTTIENIIVATNFTNSFTYLQEEDLEKIPDNNIDNPDLTGLNQEELIIYQMRVLENKTQKEIAEKLNINQSTISRKLKCITEKVLLKV